MKKKILAITGIRSDYDLMSGLYKLLKDDPDIDLKLLVGGAHLSKQYGYSVESIEKDKIDILLKVESLINSDSVSSRLKSASILLQSCIDTVSAWNPDLIIYAGDREEVWIGAMLGTYLEIPTVHFYGGDHTVSGHVDNPVRHAVSKLSTAHFVMTEEHKKRVVALGEDQKRVFVVGNLSLDNFVASQALSADLLAKQLGIKQLPAQYAMVIFHPDPSEKEVADDIFENILMSLKEKNIFAFVGYPNTDPSNQKIIKKIESLKHDSSFCFYQNLDRDAFISLYRKASVIMGNSSSGILEAASLPIPAINVGLRQRGRFAADNIIFCDSDKKSIAAALATIQTPAFIEKMKKVKNPYGDGNSCKKAHDLIKKTHFASMRLKTEDPLNV